nr:MAG TPA: Mitochondrial genome maintenance exonuclease 1, DNA complex, DNA exonuclease [Bacteriophage sp.]
MNEKRSRVQFDETTHTYTLGGVELPSVTRIIRYLAVDKANNADPNAAAIARERGTLVHQEAMLFDYTNSFSSDIDSDCAPYLEAYVQFVRDYKPGWELIEHQMGNKTLGFAGTLDRFGLIDGEYAILDIKTSYKVDVPSLSAQLTAYRSLLYKEYSPAKWDEILEKGLNLYGLQLMRDGKYRLYKCDESVGDILFQSCLKIYRATKAMKGVRYAVR